MTDITSTPNASAPSETMKPKKKKTWLKILIIVVIVLLALAAVLGFWIFGGTAGNASKISHTFFDQLAAQQTDAAYDSTASIFKEATPKEDFDKFLAAFPIMQEFSDLSFDSVERQTKDGQDLTMVGGSITGKDGQAAPIEVTLVKEDKKWHVATVNLRPKQLQEPNKSKNDSGTSQDGKATNSKKESADKK